MVKQTGDIFKREYASEFLNFVMYFRFLFLLLCRYVSRIKYLLESCVRVDVICTPSPEY